MKRMSALLIAGLLTVYVTSFAASAPSDVRVTPLLNTQWGQTAVTTGGPACFNYYTPDSSGYPPTTAGSTSNHPSGCVATALAQVLNYHQWASPRLLPGTTFNITANGTPYSGLSLKYGTLPPNNDYDWALMQNISTNLLARQEVGRLLHDLGLVLSMNYYSWTNWGSGTDFANLDGAFGMFSYSRAVTLEGNILSGGSLVAQSISPALAELAITTNLDAGLPVIIGVNDNLLQSGHALVIDGYGVDTFGTTWFHYNFSLPVYGVTAPATNLGWFTLPGVGSTNDSAGYTVLDGIAMNTFKSVPPNTPMGEIISGRIIDTGGNPLSGIRIDITCPADLSFVPITVYTNANGIFATYGTIASGWTYMVTASAAGYVTQSMPCVPGTTQKSWIVTNNPSPGDGYYNNTVGNVRADMTLQMGISIPPVPVCDLNEFAGMATFWNTSHTQITDPAVRYDYNGDWNVDMQDLHRIMMAWLMMPVEFRTDFMAHLDMPGPLPSNMPWQSAGGGTWMVVDNPFMGAESPSIGNNQSTSLKLPVKLFPGAPGMVDVTFQLDCDTEPGGDVFEFLIDGVVQMELSGQSAFSGMLNQPMVYQIPNVTSPVLKTLEWRYTKNGANNMGQDKVWISQIMIFAHP